MSVEAPFPYVTKGEVVTGFGRGGKQLGTPTANFTETVVEALPTEFGCGIYYGLAQVDDGPVYKMVMSIGYNPYYDNKQKSMETHVLHKFDKDFYGSQMKVCIIGWLRSEATFNSIDELISAIQKDIADADKYLDADTVATQFPGIFRLAAAHVTSTSYNLYSRTIAV